MTGCNDKKDKNVTIYENKLITSEEVKDLFDNGNVIIIDVRTKEEYDEKHIMGAINIPIDELEEKINNIVNDKKNNIVVYCQSGNRSGMSKNKLEQLGFVNVFDLGSINNWKYEYEK